MSGTVLFVKVKDKFVISKSSTYTSRDNLDKSFVSPSAKEYQFSLSSLCYQKKRSTVFGIIYDPADGRYKVIGKHTR